MCALLARKPAPFHIVILTLSRVKTLDAHPELSNLIIWKNLLGSIRKLHLAPVQALWWQTWTKQCNIIVDLGLQSEAAKRWPITLLLIQLFGNDSPALASVAGFHPAQSLYEAGSDVHCCSWVERNSREHHGGTALLLYSDVWSQSAADGGCVCMYEKDFEAICMS